MRARPTACLLFGALLATTGVGTLVAQTSVDGLDLEAIDRRAHKGAVDADAFVREVVARASTFEPAKRDAAEIARQASQQLAATVAHPSSRTSAPIDLDALVRGAGQSVSQTLDAPPAVLAFASLAMPSDALRQLIVDVSAAGGTIVFRGFSPSGTRSFMTALRGIVPAGTTPRMAIDPRLFDAYRVNAVPTYVATPALLAPCDNEPCARTAPDHDRLAGNVTTRFALTSIAEGDGPGAPVARVALARLEAVP